MSSNPFESPQAPLSPTQQPLGSTPGNDPMKLYRIAKAQRNIQLIILGNILCYIFFIAVKEQPVLVIIPRLIYLTLLIASFFFVYKLAKEFYDTVIAVLYTIGMLIPCGALILLLIINQKATTILQANGIKVGLLGANLKQFGQQ